MSGMIFEISNRLCRGSYTAMSVATLLNIVTPELASGAGEFVARCQTYEGGMGGYPGNEAHGG